MKKATADTLASRAYRRLREDIIGGRRTPGSRLHIVDLANELEVGASPLREALNRLVSDRLVTQFDQRGFRVAPMDVADLSDLFDARCWINEGALRAAIQRGDKAWEEGIVLALHRLHSAPRREAADNGLRGADWEDAHDAFHDALLSSCGSEWARGFCRRTSDAAVRYRAAARAATHDQRGDPQEHALIAEATLARDADRAVELLIGHFRRTQEILMQNWQQAEERLTI